MSTTKYSPKLPLQLDENDEFLSIEDSSENIKQKFKMLMLTNPGEKLMDPNFGVGIITFLFDQPNGEFITVKDDNGNKKVLNLDFSTELRQTIDRQISLYLPDISIKNISITTDDIYGYVKIEYIYGSVILDTLEFTINQ